VFDKLRKLLGGGEPPETTQTGRVRTGAGTVRRPAKARPRSSPSGKFPSLASRGGASAAPGSSRGVSVPGGLGASGGYGPASGLGKPKGPAAARSEIAQVEIPCPNCGEPMLPGWGTTCGKCRPNLVSPKTMFLSEEQVALPAHAAGSMTLGWLVVIRSADEQKRATLVELDRDRVVLSRAGAAPTGSVRVVQFDDSYMSSAHAVIGRPPTGDSSDAFTIRDRDNPAPSVNGTFVNSQKLGPGELVRLADGDVIKVGATEMLFRSLWLPPVATRST
jgi:FHA domain